MILKSARNNEKTMSVRDLLDVPDLIGTTPTSPPVRNVFRILQHWILIKKFEMVWRDTHE